MTAEPDSGRRALLTSGAVFLAASTTAWANRRSFAAENKNAEKPEVTPTEDLMQEHGVLRRLLLIYQEGLRRLGTGDTLPLETITGAAGIIRKFVEDYHEKSEEEYVFPKFRKENTLVDLVDILYRQHQKGRELTEVILQSATAEKLQTTGGRQQLTTAMQQFIRMYAPHAAREATVLFPAFRKIVSRQEFEALGRTFEEQEEEKFGRNGFEKVVEQVAEIEKKLGIHDLAQFTPSLPGR